MKKKLRKNYKKLFFTNVYVVVIHTLNILLH